MTENTDGPQGNHSSELSCNELGGRELSTEQDGCLGRALSHCTPSSFYQAGPKVDHPPSLRITWDLASARDAQGVEEGTHEGTTGLKPWMEAQSSIRSAGWKQLCTVLHRLPETRALWSLPVSDLQNSTEGYRGVIYQYAAHCPPKFRGCRDHVENTSCGKVTAVQG